MVILSYKAIHYSLSDGTYSIAAITYDSSNNASNTFKQAFQVASLNTAPSNLTFSLDKNSYTVGETLNLRNGWVADLDGIEDVSEIEFHLRKADGNIIEVADAVSINAASWSPEWGSFNHSIVLDGLKSDTYTLTLNNGWVFDRDGWDDLPRIDLEIVDVNGSITPLNRITNFIQPRWDWMRQWLGFNYSLSLGGLRLGSRSYRLRSRAYDRAGNTSNSFERSFLIV